MQDHLLGGTSDATMRSFHIILFALTAMVLGGCATEGAKDGLLAATNDRGRQADAHIPAPCGPAAKRGDIKGTTWALEALNNESVGAPAPTLTFGDAYRVTGNTGCNPIFGVYGVFGKNEVFLSSIAAAAAQCPDMALAKREIEYLEVLKTSKTVTLDNEGRLRISGGRGDAVFSPASS